MSREKVVFRRIRGRIVPIRKKSLTKEQRRDLEKKRLATASFGAGAVSLGVGAGLKVKAGGLTRKAKYRMLKTERFMRDHSPYKHQQKRKVHSIKKVRTRGERLFEYEGASIRKTRSLVKKSRNINKLSKGFIGAGSFLAGLGGAALANYYVGEKDYTKGQISEEVVGGGVGVGAYALSDKLGRAALEGRRGFSKMRKDAYLFGKKLVKKGIKRKLRF